MSKGLVHILQEEIEKTTITGHFAFDMFEFEENSDKGTDRDYRSANFYEKLRFQLKCLPSTLRRKVAIFKFFRFEEVFSKSFVFVTEWCER